MPIHVYKSSDSGAPNSLNGTIGSLIPVLDACLVNGYGAKAPAGFTKEFSGTNKAVYRAAAGNRHFFKVDDNNPYTGNFNHAAYIRGYETMSGIDTGNGPFPDVTTHPRGCSLMKHSSNNGATAREWMLITDEYFVHLLINTSGSSDADGHKGGELYNFGEGVSFKVGDPWFSIVCAGDDNSTPATIDVAWYNNMGGNSLHNGSITNSTPFVCARDHLGNAGPKSCASLVRNWGSAQFGSNSTVPYPDPVSGGLLYEDQLPITHSNVVRGIFPGIAYPNHQAPVPQGVPVVLNGRTYHPLNPIRASTAINSRQVFIDLTGPWR